MFDFSKEFLRLNSLAYITWWNKESSENQNNVDMILMFVGTKNQQNVFLNENNENVILDEIPYYIKME